MVWIIASPLFHVLYDAINKMDKSSKRDVWSWSDFYRDVCLTGTEM